MPKKKIAVIVSNNYDKDLRVQRQTESLCAHGYVPYVYCTDFLASETPENKYPNGIAVFHSAPHLPYVVKRPSGLMRYLELARTVARSNPGFTAVQSHDLNASVVGYKLSKKLGIPLVCDFHELFFGYLASDENRFLQKRALRVYDLVWNSIGKRIVNATEGFTTVNESLARIYKERWQLSTDPTVLHNYSSRKNIGHVRLVKSYFRDKFNIDSRKKVLLFQGKLFHDKGIDTIYEAFKKQQEFAVVFMGFGALAKEVIKYHESHPEIFYYHEPVPAHHLVSYTSCADLGLAPIGYAKENHYFSSPNKVYEYLSAGIPFVCSDLPEMAKIAKGTSAGAVVPVGDPVCLYHAVKDIFTNKKNVRMAEAAREAFRTRYCWEVEEEKLINLFDRIIG